MAKKNPDLRYYDKRLMDRFLARGSISQSDVEGYLKGLDDKADEAENIADLVYVAAGMHDGATTDAAD